MNRTQPWRPGWVGGRAAVAIRQTGPEDLPALGDFFAGLSAHTRYLRFFGPVAPGPALLRTLSGAADNVDALVAVRGRIIVGHAMAVDRTEPRGPRGPRVTDIGVVVGDAWQGRGIGSALMRALVTGAQVRGVTTLEMDVLGGNRHVLAMITGHWPAARVDRNSDGFAIRVRLPQLGSEPAAIMSHLASGSATLTRGWRSPSPAGASNRRPDQLVSRVPAHQVRADPQRGQDAIGRSRGRC